MARIARASLVANIALLLLAFGFVDVGNAQSQSRPAKKGPTPQIKLQAAKPSSRAKVSGKSAGKSKGKGQVKPVAKAAAKSAAKPAVNYAGKPATKGAAKSTRKPAAKGATNFARNPPSRPAAKYQRPPSHPKVGSVVGRKPALGQVKAVLPPVKLSAKPSPAKVGISETYKVLDPVESEDLMPAAPGKIPASDSEPIPKFEPIGPDDPFALPGESSQAAPGAASDEGEDQD